MSFFVSDSLKGLISEKDLEADSPIRIVPEKDRLTVHFYNDNIEEFELELISISFCKELDKIKVMTNITGLADAFQCVNKKVNYAILLNGAQYLTNSGILLLDKLEVNKEDNCVTCKIDIHKGEHLC
jgi:hypothetical protein